MEHVPLKQAFGILKWMTSLKPLDRLFAFTVAVFVASATINFYQYKEITRVQTEKNVVEKENLLYTKDCESRVARVTIKERDRADSLVAAERLKNDVQLQKLFIERTKAVRNSNEKIKTVL